MIRKYTVFILILILVVPFIKGQSTYSSGILPKINFNISLKNNWKINTALESRQFVAEGEFGENNTSDYRYERTDFTTLLIKRNIKNSSYGGGYMLRLKEGAFIHRFIQQFSYVKRYESVKIGHRMRTDQTVSKSDDFKFRLRYRVSILIPTNGHSVDPNEFYVKINNEYISIIEKTDTDLEFRVSSFLGYKILDNNKIELGIDYRVNSFILDSSDNKFLLSLVWYLSF